MTRIMSLKARREMLESLRSRYLDANKGGKSRILDGFVAATGYDRKYAIRLLNNMQYDSDLVIPKKRPGAKVYDEQFQFVLIKIWNAANQICSKRLVPFLPTLILSMERHGHLRITDELRSKLFNVSAATVDRLLSSERQRIVSGISHTKAGSLLKNQIQVRTFADWNEQSPGFFEIDLVAHCGGDPNGGFLNTLTMVDVTTGWLECMPLIRKSASNVIDGINVAKKLIPYELLGLDTDGGSEFINYDLLDYCERCSITFTRSRTHNKNDQAFVEEKNGSVVRRLVGYDRYEGVQAWEALAKFYAVLRKYINFFQPSMKLTKKIRHNGRVSKKYDTAQTPCQRLLDRDDIGLTVKQSLENTYFELDPVLLMDELKRLQSELLEQAWSRYNVSVSGDVEIPLPQTEFSYFNYNKPTDKRSLPRRYRTRKDPFEKVWGEVQLKLELDPSITARKILSWLSTRYPGEFSDKNIRTLQRRIREWNIQEVPFERKMTDLMRR